MFYLAMDGYIRRRPKLTYRSCCCCCCCCLAGTTFTKGTIGPTCPCKLNKAVCWTALTGFALTQVPGVLARLSTSIHGDSLRDTPKWLLSLLAIRKQLGLGVVKGDLVAEARVEEIATAISD